jgi:hypothetical protein
MLCRICLPLFILISAGCDGADQPPAADRTVSPAPAHDRGDPHHVPASQHGSFATFYQAFSSAADAEDLPQVLRMTAFPLLFRGQLDDEGELSVDAPTFARIWPRLMELTTFLNQGGEPIPVSYRALLMSPMPEFLSGSDDVMAAHDFVFERQGGDWKLVRVYVDLERLRALME